MSNDNNFRGDDVFRKHQKESFVAPVLGDERLKALLEKPSMSRTKRQLSSTRSRKKNQPTAEKLKLQSPPVSQQKGNTEQPESKTATPRKVRARTLHLDQEKLRKNRILIGSEAEREGMPYKILRTKAYRQFKQHGWSSVGITSPHPSDGKTTTAINLAYAFARSVQNIVVLVDFDFHRPNIHH
ncbi:MAG TPA: hypothetical protein DD827_11975, partial [Gammaproteobacteria bacterium]|nr:hypothetical protein [Gammaproteobacteria bacterium]